MEKGPVRRKIMRTVILIVGIIFLIWLLLRGIIGAIVPPVASHPVQERQMAVIAHQGGNALFPENTLMAFEGSLALGADVLEMDVHLSSDGHLVVLHDDSVDRTTDGSGAVADLSISEIRKLDAAYWWPQNAEAAPPDDGFPWRGQGIRIPTLEEVLIRFPETTKIIEMKPDNPEVVTALGNMLREHNQENLVIVASFHVTILKEFRLAYPEFATSANRPEIVSFFIMNHLGFAGSYAPPAEFFQVPVYSGSLKVITRSFVRNAQKNNITVQAWTINEEDEMKDLLDKGIDGIITDRPLLLLEILKDYRSK